MAEKRRRTQGTRSTKGRKRSKPRGRAKRRVIEKGPDFTYRVAVECESRGCQRVRMCKPQDAPLVKRCHQHQIESVKERRRLRAAARRKKLKRLRNRKAKSVDMQPEGALS